MESQKASPTVTYFPPAKSTHFTTAYTKIDAFASDKGNKLGWSIKSTTDTPAYLRQDISFLFANGELRGVHSAWKQNSKTLQYQLDLPVFEDTFWQSISLHHAEIHDDEAPITGKQITTSAKRYVYFDSEGIQSFQTAESKFEKAKKKELDYITKDHIHKSWTKLTAHYRINPDDYIILELMDLQKYDKQPLPGLTMDETKEIIGKLWEGIYKNYLIPATAYKQNTLSSPMPCILINMQQKKILVLFEFNGEKHKLIQEFS
ncbi:hypothetical protein P5G51_009370 [Virgibacillus sp. 179-BFC.A HS]|uniref:Uncharacterized protein n=1 Tax=Tigheibacillus jepli TaxID=3035914 RepID=A0ABU5CGX3_9BACI|nr:hypothetical protein [Virgibacillus sp. 179-BFC.A HS]MDY0405576.1 hypothetical protein [Virgibacillus sp. 179-BFC.A HS]